MSDVSSNNPDTSLSPVSRREGDEPSSQPTVAGSMDLSTRKDRGLLREARRQRWPVPPEMIEEAVVALRAATGVSREKGDIGGVVDCVRTLTVIVGQNQVDDHLADKNARLDEGKATERIEGVELRVLGMQAKD